MPPKKVKDTEIKDSKESKKKEVKEDIPEEPKSKTNKSKKDDELDLKSIVNDSKLAVTEKPTKTKKSKKEEPVEVETKKKGIKNTEKSIEISLEKSDDNDFLKLKEEFFNCLKEQEKIKNEYMEKLKELDIQFNELTIKLTKISKSIFNNSVNILETNNYFENSKIIESLDTSDSDSDDSHVSNIVLQSKKKKNNKKIVENEYESD